MKQLTIIGGLGFLGSHMAMRFLHEGYGVTIIDRMDTNYEEDQVNIEMSMGRHAHYTFIRENIRDVSVNKSCSNFIYTADNKNQEDLHSFLTQLQKDDFLLFISTTDIFANPMTEYGLEMKAVEEIVREKALEEEWTLVTMRLPTVYGVHHKLDLDINVSGEVVSYHQIRNRTESMLDLIYIEDVTEAVVKAMTVKQGVIEFHIGSGLKQPWGNRNSLKAQEGLTNDKAQELIGFSPKFSLKEGIAHYQEQQKVWSRQNLL
ncbi:nucleoside-diphosphate-sugar epimerase [Alkalihalobacillus xiaoxiensis]|uniref:UDP-glucose 4-epimerase n=1 Tax=Shouchella xiaoxiensis TaxID=766895 RepID=A0ABS2T103_9BACI|nr:NAD(P)-dependent oxidoreductase [Shouchella xiaoxiensis]MBM7840399.1 nucleoside-diphosphate-sugar epimerase [Shouchella xiaoxiensis]